MFPFFESIAIINGKPRNLPYHQARVETTLRAFHLTPNSVSLQNLIDNLTLPTQGKYKLRVFYNATNTKTELSKYIPRIIQKVFFKLDNTIEYPFKLTERSCLDCGSNNPNSEFIFIKNGYLTDSRFSNIILWDGNKWLTPANPLLQGTMRSSLLENKEITEDLIAANSMIRFKHFKFINALNHPSEQTSLPIHIIQNSTYPKTW